MSLFKSRDWWEIYLNENSAYDSKSLLSLTIGSDTFQRILLGSHHGFLRLYSPSSKIVDGTVLSGYEPTHLSLEVQLSSPILQIGEGVLVSGSHENHLAVLHPRLFSVYSLKKKENKKTTNVGDEMILKLSYQHALRHSAHSFALGFFGGVRGRHFVCIQSMDGHLSFYEQESFAFQIYLPDFLLPFPFAYLDKTDSFLFLNGYLTFDCYSYESLASSAGDDKKKITKTWEYPLGEEIIGVQTLNKGEFVIAILTERNLYGLNENGSQVFAKRFDFTPVAFCCYLTEEKKLMIAIATEGRYMNFYEETTLRWSMKIGQAPVCVRRIFLDQFPGGLALLSEDGFLQCVYVGTCPSLYLVPTLAKEEIDSTEAELELMELHKKIASHDSVDSSTADMIAVQVKMAKGVEKVENVRTCSVLVEIDAYSFLNRLQVSIHAEPPLTSNDPSRFFANFSGKTVFETRIYAGGPGIPSSLMAQIVVTFITNEGTGGCVNKSVGLPLALVMADVPPVKEARHKLTITTNESSSDLTDLFDEFLFEDYANSNAIGLKFVNSEEVVTVLAAKSSQRYRVQSDFLPALTLPLFALAERLEKQFRKDSGFQMTQSTPLPLDAYCEMIRNHYELLSEKKELECRLLKETSQYRTIQKKILISLKDATPKSSSDFYRLLAETSHNIASTLNELEGLEEKAEISRCYLRSSTRLVSGLLDMSNMSEENSKLIRNLLNPFVYDADDQGWLEIQEATSTYLLRRVLAKSTKDRQNQTDINLEPVKDPSKLIKHLSRVIDRVVKGDYHPIRKSDLDRKDSDSYQERDETFFEDVIPAGTKFANVKEEEKTEKESMKGDGFNDAEKLQRLENEDNRKQIIQQRSAEEIVERINL